MKKAIPDDYKLLLTLKLESSSRSIAQMIRSYNGSLTPNNLLQTVRSDCKKIGCRIHCFQLSEASPIGQSGANLFKNYLV